MGNLIGGWAADRNLMPNLYLILATLAAVLIIFVFAVHQPAPATITILLFGITGFATVPPFQARMMAKAAAAPTLASTVNIAAFNLGNAIGAWLGGLAIAAHFGYAAPNVVGALLVLAGLGTAVFSGTLDRRSERSGKTADMSQVTT
jgi:DHA1 family inner membrane transport protein